MEHPVQMGGDDHLDAAPNAPRRIVTLFRSRLKDDDDPEFAALEREVEAAARAMPGFIEFSAFRDDSGERLAVVAFASAGKQRHWRDHPLHQMAQELGKKRYFSSYTITICEFVEEWSFSADR